MEEVFDRSWRCRCRIEQVSVSDLAEFIRSHYLGKRPAIVLLSLAMLCDDEPVGCIVFSAPPREIEKRYGGTTWELSRLYLLDHVPRNAESWLISKACRWIRVNRRDVQYLVSYASESSSSVADADARWPEGSRMLGDGGGLKEADASRRNGTRELPAEPGER
jgi:hypothetical protein